MLRWSQVRELAPGRIELRMENVLVATSGEAAESIARQHKGPIDLLLTDVVMPQTSGRDLADRICEARPTTRVLWMSGYADETIAHHGMLEPGLHFLQKPFTPETLAHKVREVLDTIAGGERTIANQ